VVANASKKILIDEPSVVAVSKQTKEIVCYAEEAKRLEKISSDDVEVLSLFSGGKLLDQNIYQDYISSIFGRLSHSFIHLFIPYPVVYLIPVGFPPSHQKLLREALLRAHLFPIRFVTEIIGDTKLGAGDVSSERTICTIRVGGTQTQLFLSLGLQKIHEVAIPMGGKDIDEALRIYIYQKYGMLVSAYALQNVKEEYTRSQTSGNVFSFVVRGKHIQQGSVMSLHLGPDDLHDVVRSFFETLVAQIHFELRSYLEVLRDPTAKVECFLSGGCAVFPEFASEIVRQLECTPELVSRPHVASVLGVVQAYSRKEL
jgi:rod shape-determining protein MreB